MSVPTVSVVIPTRNRRELLIRTLHTVLDQQRVSFEVLVVDDASEDGTAARLRLVGDPRVLVIRNEAPQGVAGARNVGLKHARGEWVAFKDDDDLWAPSKLAMQLDAITSDPEAGWSYPGAVTVDDCLRIVSAETAPPRDRLHNLLAFNIIPGGGSGAMVRTELARSVGGFDPRLSLLADWDMWIRLMLQALPAIIDRPLVAYLRHGGSMSSRGDGFVRELHTVDSKHASARTEWGVLLNRKGVLGWNAAMQLLAGRRLHATSAYLWLLCRHRDGKSLLRAGFALLWPEAMIGRSDRRSLAPVPPDWLAEAEAWLAPLRAAGPLHDAAPAAGQRPRLGRPGSTVGDRG
jgi:glycosyltransferase involved in cell wall biosynthesis